MKQLLLRRKEGQGLVEYSLIIVLVAIVIIVALQMLGPVVSQVYARISAELVGPGAISGATVGYGMNNVLFNITVSEPTMVHVSGTVEGSHNCTSSGPCSFALPGPESGWATITADVGGVWVESW